MTHTLHFGHTLDTIESRLSESSAPISQQWTTRDEIRYIDGLGTWTMRKRNLTPRHILLREYLTVSARRPAETFGNIDAETVRMHAMTLLSEVLAEGRG